MKNYKSLILILLILVVLVITNPGTEDYVNWTMNKVKNPDQPVANFFTGTLGKPVLREGTYRNNYYILSIFDFNDNKTLGILNMFFTLNYDFNEKK